MYMALINKELNMNVAGEVLNSFQGATKELLGFFMANADKEILSEESAALPPSRVAGTNYIRGRGGSNLYRY